MTITTPGSDGPVPIALALLDRQWPAGPPLADTAGASTSGAIAAIALESHPRYLIGRLQQALTTLLATELPSSDPAFSGRGRA